MIETKAQTLTRFKTGDYEPVRIKDCMHSSYYLRFKSEGSLKGSMYAMRYSIGKDIFEGKVK